MKKVGQQIMSAAADRPRGDCVRACVASIFERDLEEVPHVVELQEQVGYHWLSLLNGWLRKEGYPFEALERCWSEAASKIAQPYYYLRARPHDARHKRQWVKSGFEMPGYWIMSVRSKNFKRSHHAVVAREDRIVWDPSPNFGKPEYDRRPYWFEGWGVIFVVTDPTLVLRKAA